jgi:hypothetical protein
VERRNDPRYPADLAVWVTDLLKPGRSAPGTIRDISSNGVSIIGTLPLGAGDLVRLDVADSVLFGIVTYGNADASSWRIGVEVQRVLHGGSDLSQLLQRVLQEELPAVVQGSLR